MSDQLPFAPRPFHYDPPQHPQLDVIYEDADILVLNKPSGLLTVAGNVPSLADCLEERARNQYPGARIVHRLDKDTSGVIVLGLSAKTHANLGLQFEKRKTSKTYIARVWGTIPQDSGKIDKPIGTDWPNRPKQKVDFDRGRAAITDWRVLEREENTTRLELTPYTGRTHQLRVHMYDFGYPILGDNLYAHTEALNAAPILQLHALTLKFTHPVLGAPCTFTATNPF